MVEEAGAAADLAGLTRLMTERHSCRAFRPDLVPRDVIDAILHLAQRTASWCNAQPWQIAITEGAATDRLRAALVESVRANRPAPDLDWPAAYNGVYGDRRRTCGFQLYNAVGVARDDKAARAVQGMRNFKLFDAPHVAIVTVDAALGTYGVMDCGGFVANFLLAAQAHGVATIAQAALAGQAPTIRRELGLSDDRPIVCGISFGYPDTSHPANGFRTERASLAETATFLS